MGDPAGIGPEVALKAITAAAVAARVEPILVGDLAVWQETAHRLRLGLGLGLRPASIESGKRVGPRAVQVVVTSTLAARYRVPGEPRTLAAVRACGAAAYAAILEAVRLVQTGEAAGMVTAPINKAHLVAAGHEFPGHTELLAQLAGGVPVRMMLAGPRLRVVLVTTHVRLADVPRCVTREVVLETITITARSLRERFGIAAPRIAVAGLNPHAGEHGLFGDEESRIITPAVRVARRRGINVTDPLAADGLFAHAADGEYDAIVCMYHDQGLAPFKLLHFADGVNVTLGLPFVRTSPDHGTAFDIAGSGRADARSMIAAVQMAAEAARRRTPQRQSHMTLVRRAATAVS
jgi:4-hydroxythreonine-4-phosphate dehydrogenase